MAERWTITVDENGCARGVGEIVDSLPDSARFKWRAVDVVPVDRIAALEVELAEERARADRLRKALRAIADPMFFRGEAKQARMARRIARAALAADEEGTDE